MKNTWISTVEQFRKEHQIAGFTVAATDRTHTLFVEGFGVESVERPAQAPTEDTMYRIASISKVVTVAATALAETIAEIAWALALNIL